MKVTTIEEANYITSMKLDELFGYLRTFEQNLEMETLKRKVKLLFRLYTRTFFNRAKNVLMMKNLAESIALLIKQVSKLRSLFQKRAGN